MKSEPIISDCVVSQVRLPGAGELPFRQAFGALIVRLPERLPTPYVNMLEIRGTGL